MKEQVVRVEIREGLHARPATEFVKTAVKFSSDIKLGKDGKFIDAKSILGLMSMAIAQGQEVTLQATGSDEEKAIEALAKLLTEGE
ncbi:HPr family phosphocarrier protein [Alicyclobacillus ferrooxydans]|uniref:Phosphocarrier protein HPr n=1 Tax=Alicyclobacillus ferrooxydans TaxID=471514 RepID=A0A0P9GRT5_9BACL|nr:HPr family phosphocarrier protein [Alicyclobacillus ferrooxydans]KPV43743.1 hypothetical protein AN477_10130 [Alicyclobacillus ferrooxydans]